MNNKTNAEKQLDKKDVPAPIWNANISDIKLDDFSILAKDLLSKGKGQIQIDKITLNTKNFSTLPEKKAENNISFNLNNEGIVNISGQTGLNPLTADLALSFDQIQLPEFQEFVSEYANLIISKGKFSSTGQFTTDKTRK